MLPGPAERLGALRRPRCLSCAYREICDNGPALFGKFAVLTTWMPARCSPLNGVTMGAVTPGSQPRANGSLGLLNQTPRWNWCVGGNVTVPPGDTENVSLSKMPCTVALPEPFAPTLMSD